MHIASSPHNADRSRREAHERLLDGDHELAHGLAHRGRQLLAVAQVMRADAIAKYNLWSITAQHGSIPMKADLSNASGPWIVTNTRADRPWWWTGIK